MDATATDISLDAWSPELHVTPQPGPGRRRRQPGLGRSGPRSRAGCVICKQRRVRCDELHPTCGHCRRMQLECYYQPLSHQPRKTTSYSRGASHAPGLADPKNSYQASAAAETASGEALVSTAAVGVYPYAELSSIEQLTFPFWSDGKSYNFADLAGDLPTSSGSEFQCLFPEEGDLPNSSSIPERHDVDSAIAAIQNAANGGTWDTSSLCPLSRSQNIAEGPQAIGTSRPQGSSLQTRPVQALDSSPQTQTDGSTDSDRQPRHLLEEFQRIGQPPAPILMGGSWRHLQHYLCAISEQNRAVESALLCVIDLLTLDGACVLEGGSPEEGIKRVHDRHQRACNEIRTKLAGPGNPRPKVSEHLLAAIFLLAWFEVVRDQDSDQSLFPWELADSIISSQSRWSRTSQELLSWLNVLDFSATHLRSEHLLSEQALKIVSHYPAQMTTPHTWEQVSGPRQPPADESDAEGAPGSVSRANQLRKPHHLDFGDAPGSAAQVKQALLTAILQPALQWHLKSQSYWRRISTHHTHHRNRHTTEDEYEVITACKQVEAELFDLWTFRPAIISTTAQQLRQIVPADLAASLEQVFSIYLASFWILFVYMHRVSWWDLPHSELARWTLAKVWQSLQRACGEEAVVDGAVKKSTVHPSLVWVLFVFGSECTEQTQRAWAIAQFEALGEYGTTSVVDDGLDTVSGGMLPPFRFDSGPVRNARRAAVLLTKVTEEQERLRARADVRKLSMELFGRYLSIV